MSKVSDGGRTEQARKVSEKTCWKVIELFDSSPAQVYGSPGEISFAKANYRSTGVRRCVSAVVSARTKLSPSYLSETASSESVSPLLINSQDSSVRRYRGMCIRCNFTTVRGECYKDHKDSSSYRKRSIATRHGFYLQRPRPQLSDIKLSRDHSIVEQPSRRGACDRACNG